MSNTNKCSCSTTYYRSNTFTVGTAHCDKWSVDHGGSGCQYGWTVSGRQISASGSGSTCAAAGDAMNDDFYSKFDFDTDCECNNPEPVKTGSARASNDLPSSSGSQGYVNVTVNAQNGCSSSKTLTVYACCNSTCVSGGTVVVPANSPNWTSGSKKVTFRSSCSNSNISSKVEPSSWTC